MVINGLRRWDETAFFLFLYKWESAQMYPYLASCIRPNIYIGWNNRYISCNLELWKLIVKKFSLLFCFLCLSPEMILKIFTTGKKQTLTKKKESDTDYRSGTGSWNIPILSHISPFVAGSLGVPVAQEKGLVDLDSTGDLRELGIYELVQKYVKLF